MIRIIGISQEDLPLEEMREMAEEIRQEIEEASVSTRGIGTAKDGVVTVYDLWSGKVFHRFVWPYMAYKGTSVTMLVDPDHRLVARGVAVRPASDAEVEPRFWTHPTLFNRGGWWEVRVD
jgi:hypothetical protein